MSDDKNILVVGGSGFIGSAFLRYMRGLWEIGDEVRALTRDLKKVSFCTGGGPVMWEQADLQFDLGPPIMRTDALVYICGQNRGPGYSYEVDLRCAENMCKYAKAARIERCVLISSGAVSQMPNRNEPVWATEYRETKAQIEKMFSQVFDRLIIHRVYSLVGPRMPKTFALRKFIDMSQYGEKIVVSNPWYATSYLSTWDLARFIAVSLDRTDLLMQGPRTLVYETDGGASNMHTLHTVASMVATVFGGPGVAMMHEAATPTSVRYEPIGEGRQTHYKPAINLMGALQVLKHYGVDS